MRLPRQGNRPAAACDGKRDHEQGREKNEFAHAILLPDETKSGLAQRAAPFRVGRQCGANLSGIAVERIIS